MNIILASTGYSKCKQELPSDVRLAKVGTYRSGDFVITEDSIVLFAKENYYDKLSLHSAVMALRKALFQIFVLKPELFNRLDIEFDADCGFSTSEASTLFTTLVELAVTMHIDVSRIN